MVDYAALFIAICALALAIAHVACTITQRRHIQRLERLTSDGQYVNLGWSFVGPVWICFDGIGETQVNSPDEKLLLEYIVDAWPLMVIMRRANVSAVMITDLSVFADAIEVLAVDWDRPSITVRICGPENRLPLPSTPIV